MHSNGLLSDNGYSSQEEKHGCKSLEEERVVVWNKAAVAVDGSEASYQAVIKAAEMISDTGQLLLIDVKDPAIFIQPAPLGTTYGEPGATENLELLSQEWDQNARVIENKARSLLQSTKVAVQWRVVTVGMGHHGAAQVFLDTATQWEADVIVAGRHHGSRIVEGMFGSFPRWLLNHSSLPVLIVPPRAADVAP